MNENGDGKWRMEMRNGDEKWTWTWKMRNESGWLDGWVGWLCLFMDDGWMDGWMDGL